MPHHRRDRAKIQTKAPKANWPNTRRTSINAQRYRYRLFATASGGPNGFFAPISLESPVSDHRQLSCLRPGGVYLITGGLGKLGLTLAEYFSKTVQAKLVLIGRSYLPPKAQWQEWLETHPADEATGQKIRQVQALEERGAEVLVMAADVADEKAMGEVLAQIDERFGGLHGVVHAAGIPESVAIQELQCAHCERQFKPKIYGLSVLEKLLRGRPLDFCCLTSSLSAVLGGLGFSAYASANLFMDAFAQRQNRTGTFPWISVNWDGWNFKPDEESQVGRGSLAITPNEGREAFARIFSTRSSTSLAVSTHNLQERLDQWINPVSSRQTSAPEPASLLLHQRPAISSEYVAPKNQTEECIAKIWGQLLGVEKVGVHDTTVFELGGHSLLATRLTSLIRSELGAELSIRTLFEAPTVAGLVKCVEEAKPARVSLRPRPRPERIPLSFAQQRLWFLDRFDGPSPTYNIPYALRLERDFSLPALEASLMDVVARHESLRTVFAEIDGTPHQQILAAETAQVIVERVAVSEAELPQALKRAASTCFNLAQEIPLRAWLFHVDEKRQVLLLLLHHIAGDGWSLAPLVRDLTIAYAARSQGQSPAWSPLPVQYADFTLWQRQLFGKETDPTSAISRQIAYWKGTLAGLPELLLLPTDRPRPAVATHHGDSMVFKIEPGLHQGLLKLAQESQTTLFMVLQAGLAALLTRLGAGADIPLGSPVAGRGDEALNHLVGFFVNTLVLRTDTSGNPTFKELLARVRRTDLEAYAHQDLPFERLVEILNPVRSQAHQPLFQVMLVLQNFAGAGREHQGLAVGPEPLASLAAQFDLTFYVRERQRDRIPQGIFGQIEYATDLFDHSSVKALAGRLVRLLTAVVADASQPICSIDLLDTAERQQILTEWNGTAHAVPERTLPALLEAQVKKSPEAVALVFEEKSLTYGRLNESANRLAHLLIARGIGPEDIVALCLPRSFEMVVALFAILKVGAAYLPLDPDYPPERLALMLEDAGPKALLTLSEMGASLHTTAARLFLDAEETQERLAQNPAFNPDDRHRTKALDPLHPAYVIYTSGSTGTPKGVIITHQAVVNFLDTMRRAPGLTSEDVLAAITPLSFDIAGLELYLPLVVGAKVVVVSRAIASEGQPLGALLDAVEASVLQATPASWRLLTEANWQPKRPFKALCGGEALPQKLARRLSHFNGETWNLYGPTETTIWSTIHQVVADETGSVTSIRAAHRQYPSLCLG